MIPFEKPSNIILLCKKIPNNIILKSIIKLGSCNAFSQLFVFLSIPIYTRLFDTNTIGNFTLIYTTAIFIATISSLRLDSAIVIARTRVSTVLLCLLALGSSIIIAFIITLFSFIYFFNIIIIYTL